MESEEFGSRAKRFYFMLTWSIIYGCSLFVIFSDRTTNPQSEDFDCATALSANS